jgi:ketosteroid isomerase-like protein
MARGAITRRAALAWPALAAPALAAWPALAHPPAVLSPGAQAGVVEEIMAFRRAFAEAAQRRDRVKLTGFYADRFSHSDEAVRGQDKAARLALLLAGAALFETAPGDNLRIVVHAGGWAAVATGTARLREADGATRPQSWTQMLARRGDDAWQIVASHASRLPEGGG